MVDRPAAEAEALLTAVADLIEAASARPRGARDAEVSEPPLEADELAWRVACHQRDRVEAYRNLWTAGTLDATSRSLGASDGWRRAPAVPTSAFKEPALRLWTAPPRITFRSSGTTRGGERRSEHHHPYPELYRRIVDASFPHACLDPELRRGEERVPMLSLVPPLRAVPDSSLGFMIDHVVSQWGDAASRVALTEAGLEADIARSFLRDRADDGRPALVLATALALDALLSVLESDPLVRTLPRGSVIFETGGFKGREQQLERADLVERVARHLGVGPRRIVREYGMTELTSQAYTRVLEGGDPDTFHPPPWLLWRLVDPATGREVADGREGLIAFFDLGNLGSISHVLTEDIGRASRDGGFELLGRATDAELRGCSLTAEELLR